MFGVLLSQLLGVYLIYKGVRYIVNRDVSGGGNGSNSTQSSFQQHRDVYINNDNITGYDNNNNGGGNGDSSAHAFGQRIRYVYNDIVTRITGSNNNGFDNNQSQAQSHTLYTPLTSDIMESSRERGSVNGGSYDGNEIVFAPSAPTVVTRTVYHQPAVNANNNTVHNPMMTKMHTATHSQPQAQQYTQPQYTSLSQEPPQPVMYYAPRVASAQPVSNINMM